MQQDEQHNAKWFGLASIWLGGMVSIPSLLIGSTLISGLNFTSAIITGLLGLTFVTVFMCLESVAAVEQRLNLVQLAKSAYGTKGSTILIGAIVGLATIGWFGVQTNIAGTSFSKILNDTFGILLPDAVSAVFWGVIMLVTAVYGFTFMKWLNYIAVPAIVLLMIYGLSISFEEFGWSEILAYQAEEPMSILSAIGLTIGFISVGGVISPDINHFAQTRRDAILGSIMGVLPAGLLLLSVGAILGISQGTHDITEIFSRFGYPVLALSILILATWTTNVVNAYSGGLAINQLLGLSESKRALSTLIAGAIGTAMAVLGILNHFIGFLTILTTAIPPIAGVIISDYWLAKSFKKNYEHSINWFGIGAWLIGVFTMVLMKGAVKNLLSIFIAAIAYYFFHLIFNKRNSWK